MIVERYAGPDERADTYWMNRALDQARLGEGATSPNPPVGAVIVKGDRLLARGHHAKAGLPHAEAVALNNLEAPEAARGATLYVTLEPCSTHGKTPPCVEAIAEAGIGRVVYGSHDPNPTHAGKAEHLLKAGGIDVTAGVLGEACDHLIRAFSHWVRHRRPYVLAKAAISLDGRLTKPPSESSWLTSPQARRDAQKLRRIVDAILVGAETLRKDNPSLTCRDPQAPAHKRPLTRVVLTRSGRLPADARVFTDPWAEHTWVYRNVVSWDALGEALDRRGITSVLVEGGGEILSQVLASRWVQEIWLYLAPRVCGGPDVVWRESEGPLTSIELQKTRWTALGNDLRVSGVPVG